MRTAVLIAVTVFFCGLAGGCSRATVSEPAPTTTSRSAPARSGNAVPTPSPSMTLSTPSPSVGMPRNGAPIAEVIGWVEAGRPADAADYHAASRDGVTTELGADIAFTAAGGGSAGATRCGTDAGLTGGALACLVDLGNPAPAPDEIYGKWKGNWVDFDGATLQVGSAHADPGPFDRGDGRGLVDGAALSFGDYRCRADRAGLVCVNYAHRSAAKFSGAGVEPFGCLRPVPAPPDAGRLWRC